MRGRGVEGEYSKWKASVSKEVGGEGERTNGDEEEEEIVGMMVGECSARVGDLMAERSVDEEYEGGEDGAEKVRSARMDFSCWAVKFQKTATP